MRKKRPKNKQEIDSFSGHKPKKVLRTKQVVDFQFTVIEGGAIVRRPYGRLKINPEGGVSCLVFTRDKWMPIKAHLDWINIKQVVIKNHGNKRISKK